VTWSSPVYDPLLHLEGEDRVNTTACGQRLLASNIARNLYLFARNLASRRYRVCPDCEFRFQVELHRLREAGEGKRAELLLMTTYEGATHADVAACDKQSGDSRSPLAG
jgi:hypothetical protein